MAKIKKAQYGFEKNPAMNKSKRKVIAAEKEGNPNNPRLESTYTRFGSNNPTRYSTDTTGYAAGKKAFPTLKTSSSGKTYRTVSTRKEVEGRLENPSREGFKKGGKLVKGKKAVKASVKSMKKKAMMPKSSASMSMMKKGGKVSKMSKKK